MAILWTDRPELAFYAEFFNASQDRYKIEVIFYESPARMLADPAGPGAENPDIVVARWLNSASTRAMFRPLDNLFTRDGLNESSFYTELLSQGRIERRQHLLPVNFNIPAMVFARDFSQAPANLFSIEMTEIRERGRAHNTQSNGVYSQMGFSPSANIEFLFVAATLFGANFREADPISWDSWALEQSIRYVQEWIIEANTSIQAEDDFVYRYFYDPPDRLVNSGRILYFYMDSSRFFTLPEERRANLDFRWIGLNERIPLDEGSVFYGIHRRTRARRASEAFTRWFFNIETQRLLLEARRNLRLSETSFGIAGGFSGMRTVTEQVFPQFYPDLIGHLPPEDFLAPANVLPRSWLPLKERVILPYLRERIRHSDQGEIRPLDRRISDWYRLNRD